MHAYVIFKDLAIILFSAEIFALLAKKCKAPQVVGQIIAGLVIGNAILGFVNQSEFLNQMAEIGVVLLMFSAGLETDLKELISTGPLALLVACVGVFVPLAGGFVLYSFFVFGMIPEVGSQEFYEALFIGTIMTATSVTITVQTLRELGHLKGKIGTLILSAAIIDDVIGIVVLTFVTSLAGGSEGSSDGSVGKVLLNILLFFVVTVIVGILVYKLFKFLDNRYPHRRRIPILSLAFALVLSFCAEALFGIADITGAYAAGIILSSLKDSSYIERKMDISSYMIFGPIFFVNIGLKTDFSDMTADLLMFSVLFVLVALLTKVIGCGLTARLCKHSTKDSLKVGVGMMTRGEVALIVASKGLTAGLMDQKYFASVILLIICSSVVTPIIMKLLYRGEKAETDTPEKAKA
ncbi:MAG: cation:proton antiporter [Oscillospiraceae bacterium]|nr:cation:proton antiporter [Oscillospiraceae bacterium]